jgi:hypothetical protein|tara:strand:- start:103 stop:252 length:150 start_codon:yes stop_codon:yes gene_type:complete
MSSLSTTTHAHMQQVAINPIAASRLSASAVEGKRNEDGRPTESRGFRVT